MRQKISTYILPILLTNSSIYAQEENNGISKVDYSGFLRISGALGNYRQKRMIDIQTFNAYSKGAIDINFSDFTKKTLADKIANKNTRILIYCNNNFESRRESLMNKMTPLALNIPTFINLYGYGYKNIYELRDYLSEDDERVQLKTSEH